MTDAHFAPALLRKPGATAANATWGMSIAAALLAILIGLSAVDINAHRQLDADQAQSSHEHGLALDGRGKWGGYTRPVPAS